MPKYYVQSGDSSTVIAANNAETAAIYIIHRAINSLFPIDDIDIRLLNRVSMELVLRGLDDLEPLILVSQIGFGRCDAGHFDTERLFLVWRGRIDSMNFLFEKFTEKLGES